MLPQDVEERDLPDKWFCELNERDNVNNTCEAPEKDRAWYYRHLIEGQTDILQESPVKCIARDTADSALSQEEKAKLVEKDVILKKLLTVTASDQQSSVISKHYFHDALLAETEEEVVNDDVLAACGELARQEKPDTEASAKKTTREQPDRESLIESTDKAYAQAHLSDTIGDIIKSIQAQYSMKFEKATKAIVRSRLKELMIETSPPAKGKDELLPTIAMKRASSDQIPIASSEAQTLGSDNAEVPLSVTASLDGTAGSPSSTPEKSSSTSTRRNSGAGSLTTPSSVARSSTRASVAQVASLPSDSPPVENGSSPSTPRNTPSPAQVSTLKKSRGRSGRKHTDSQSFMEDEKAAPGSDRSSSPSVAQGTSSSDSVDSPSAMPRGGKDACGSRPSAKREKAPRSRTRETRGSGRPPRKSKQPEEIIELSSDSESTDAEVVEILSD